MFFEKQKIFYRCIKKNAVVLMVLADAPVPIRVKDLADVLDIDQETARNYLRPLKELGLIERKTKKGGYTLTEAGISLFSGGKNNAENPHYGSSGNGHHNAENPHYSIDNEENPRYSGDNEENPRYDSSLARSINLSKNNNGNLAQDQNNAENPHYEIQKAYDLIEQLLGESLVPGKYDPCLLLGWLAQTHDIKKRLKTPTRFLYKKLMSGEQPDKRYSKSPWFYLPEWFNEAVGLDKMYQTKVITGYEGYEKYIANFNDEEEEDE